MIILLDKIQKKTMVLKDTRRLLTRGSCLLNYIFSNRYAQLADCKENMSSIEPRRMHLIYPSHNISEKSWNKPTSNADFRKSDRVASGQGRYWKAELKHQNITPDYIQKKTFTNEYKNEISRTKSWKQPPASYMHDILDQTDEFDEVNEDVDHNTLNTYLEK